MPARPVRVADPWRAGGGQGYVRVFVRAGSGRAKREWVDALVWTVHTAPFRRNLAAAAAASAARAGGGGGAGEGGEGEEREAGGRGARRGGGGGAAARVLRGDEAAEARAR